MARRERAPISRNMILRRTTFSMCRTKLAGRRVVETLHSRFAPAGPKSRDRYSSNPEAYNEFISGLGESFAKRPETLKSAVQHLSRAVERDPDFALAHATLSHVSMILDFEFE